MTQPHTICWVLRQNRQRQFELSLCLLVPTLRRNNVFCHKAGAEGRKAIPRFCIKLTQLHNQFRVTCARGKVETRTCWQSGDPDWFADKWKWHGPKSVCKVRCEVYDKKTGTTTVDERYFISSMSVDAKKALDTVRAHWGVEAMHWILDMDFDEDHSRARTGNAAENLAMPRHVVLNVLRLDRTIFGGISKKRKELTWNEDKLFRLLLAA